MEYIAYILIVLALLIELRDNIKGKTDSFAKQTRNHMLSTLLFLTGIVIYIFTDYVPILLIAFIAMTTFSSWLLGITVAIYLEDEEEGISREIKKKREKIIKDKFYQII